MSYEFKQTYGTIIASVLNGDEKKYKEVRAVVKDGKTIRRAHLRNYGRSVKGGKSIIDRMKDNITSSNGLLKRLMKERIYERD